MYMNMSKTYKRHSAVREMTRNLSVRFVRTGHQDYVKKRHKERQHKCKRRPKVVQYRDPAYLNFFAKLTFGFF